MGRPHLMDKEAGNEGLRPGRPRVLQEVEPKFDSWPEPATGPVHAQPEQKTMGIHLVPNNHWFYSGSP